MNNYYNNQQAVAAGGGSPQARWQNEGYEDDYQEPVGVCPNCGGDILEMYYAYKTYYECAECGKTYKWGEFKEV